MKIIISSADTAQVYHSWLSDYRMDVGEAEELYSAYGGTTPRSKVSNLDASSTFIIAIFLSLYLLHLCNNSGFFFIWEKIVWPIFSSPEPKAHKVSL